MSVTKKIAFGGVFCALSIVTLLCSVVPYATYASVALAGMMLVPCVLEFDCRFGMFCFAVTAILATLLTPDLEAKCLFIFFFGYYPMCQIRLQIWRRRVCLWIVKFILFNAALAVVYVLLILVIKMPIEETSPLYAVVLWCVGNVAFAIYDRALVRVGVYYRLRIHPLIKQFLK